METFLRFNGYTLSLENSKSYDLVIAVAQGEITKDELIDTLTATIVPKNRG